jgi:hypothetical protein
MGEEGGARMDICSKGEMTMLAVPASRIPEPEAVILRMMALSTRSIPKAWRQALPGSPATLTVLPAAGTLTR